MRFSKKWLALLCIRSLLEPPVSHAQTAENDLIHWAYAAYFGTGRYHIGDTQDTYTFSFRPGWQGRESALDADGNRRIGIRFRVPVAISTHDFEPSALLDNIEPDNVSTLSVVPGVEIEIPMTPRWTLKSLAYLGLGSDMNSSGSAWIHWLGIKSQLEFQSGETDWMLINALTRVGYSPNSSRSGQIVPLLTGLEFRRPLKNKRMGDSQAYLNWHVGYTNYLDEIGLARDTTQFVDIDDEWELGIGFSKGQGELKLWRLSWDRVGLAYRFDSDGDFSGVSLVFRSLFDR